MTSHDDVPYADSEPLAEIIEECRCVESECASHGITLHPRDAAALPHQDPVTIGETTRHIVDGYGDYGT
jgi:hypothetical protein